MNFPMVPEYRNDILNINPENKILREPFEIPAGAKKGHIVVPLHSPFFVKSLKVYNGNGQELNKGDKGDYRIFRIMGGLTELTAKSVSCMIEFLNTDIRSGWIDYDIVGHFSLFDAAFLKMVEEVANDERPVWWDNLHNKPQWFRPKLHQHSLLYEIVGLKDMVDLVDLMMGRLEESGRTALEIKFDHYIGLMTHYIDVYKQELTTMLNRHKGAYNAHGYNKAQSGLILVDNFPTARGADLLQPRRDRHLTPDGIRTIIDAYGFNSTDLLEQNKVPISQFGNSNFIPANIDGSFEGLGGTIETGGMCLESDGTITYLCNRMDGRVRGLYYSVMENPTDNAKAELSFTGYKYEHAKFNASGANVDRIAQGSGDECILVGDSVNNIYFIGLTNGSNDPARHVYSKINLRPLVEAIFSSPAAIPVSSIWNYLSIALMGDWVYIFLTSSVSGPSANPVAGSQWAYKHIFRVPIATIKTTVDVTPVRQLVSFTDADGAVVANSPWWRHYSVTRDAEGNVVKALYTFSPYASNGFIGGYRTAATLVAQDPTRPGIYAVKFICAYYAAYTSSTINGSMDLTPEINYDFNPVTGVFTLKSQSPTFNINFAASPVVPPQYQVSGYMRQLVFMYQAQGLNVFEDGRISSCGAFGFSGFPRAAMILDVLNSNSRFASVSRFWGTGTEIAKSGVIRTIAEKMISPIESSVCPRAFLYVPEGEYYVAGERENATVCGLYFKAITGRFVSRPEINNLYMTNVVARALTNNIRKVNAPIGLGGATISVPSAQLATWGIDVGESSFCVGFQKKDADRELIGGAWTGGVAAGDVILMATHSRRLETDGTITLVPGLEILYPEAIINALKAQVANPGMLPAARSVIVTVADPTFSTLARFGWLPVTVTIQYPGPAGTGDVNALFVSVFNIQPTYVDSGGRKVVSGFTILNALHERFSSYAMYTPRAWGGNGAAETPLSTFDPARVQYYLEGNKLTVHHGAGVVSQTPGDSVGVDVRMVFNNRASSHAWSTCNWWGRSSRGSGFIMTPDNGIQVMRGWDIATGGAATISEGAVNHPLVGSVYPEVGWTVFFKTAIKATFNGKLYSIPAGSVDLRNVVADPTNKTFYIYAVLRNGVPVYEITQEKRLETPNQVWVSKVITGLLQILTIERYNVFTLNGNRISEIKRGNVIPASSGLANEEGQLPWLRTDELLP